MPINIRNMDYFRSLSSEQLPGFGARLHETLTDLLTAVGTIEQQTNSNASGQPSPPPAIQALNVTGQNGHFQIAITDKSPVFRDVHYWVDHADNPQFRNSHTIDMGQTRNHNVFLGNVQRYFRAYSSYSSSPPSATIYHGGTTPQPVSGGGSVGGPAFLNSQSSGTGKPGQGPQGPGTIPFRSATGAQPTRGD